MNNCYRCGVSEEKALLSDAITNEGVKKICRKCSFHEDVPVMRSLTPATVQELEKKHDIYDKVSRVSGIDNKKKLNSRSLKLEQQETTLKDLIEKNVCKGLSKQAKPRNDLVKNFHWILKRQRRLKHLSPAQFAKELGEAEKTILMAEQGVVPEGYDLIHKLESSLNVNLIAAENAPRRNEIPKELKFDRFSTKQVTIGDLKQMNSKPELEKFRLEDEYESEEESFSEAGNKSSFSSQKNLDDEDDMVFGKK